MPNEKAAEWYNRGVELSKLGRYEEAVDCYDQAINLDPNDASTWYGKGCALSGLARYLEEIECYDRAIKLDPQYTSAWYNKGVALSALGRNEEAIQCYNEVLRLDPGDELAMQAKNSAETQLSALGRGVADMAFELVTAVNSSPAAQAKLKKWDRIAQFLVTDGAPFSIEFSGMTAIGPVAGLHPNPNITFESDEATFIALLKGEIGATRAYISRRLKIRGSLRDAGKFNEILETATRKPAALKRK